MPNELKNPEDMPLVRVIDLAMRDARPDGASVEELVTCVASILFNLRTSLTRPELTNLLMSANLFVENQIASGGVNLLNPETLEDTGFIPAENWRYMDGGDEMMTAANHGDWVPDTVPEEFYDQEE